MDLKMLITEKSLYTMMNEVVEFISGTYPWKMDRPYIVVVGERAGTPQTSSEKVITQKRFWKNDAWIHVLTILPSQF